MLDVYRETTARNLEELEIKGDVVVVHDPQPAGLIQRRNGDRRWIWRCHIDISTPNRRVWDFLRPYVDQYDSSVFSMPEFSQRLQIPQFRIAPSIDPLSDKNKELPQAEVDRTLARYGLDPDRPILTQISRFDRLKDPVGVIQAYRLVKRRHDCQLILAGGAADDDPEGAEMLRAVEAIADGDADIHILALPPRSDLEINALVRGSTVVLQKSIKEGFGLTVNRSALEEEAGDRRRRGRDQAADPRRRHRISRALARRGREPRDPSCWAIRACASGSARTATCTSSRTSSRRAHIRDYLLMILALEDPAKDIRYLVGLP